MEKLKTEIEIRDKLNEELLNIITIKDNTSKALEELQKEKEAKIYNIFKDTIFELVELLTKIIFKEKERNVMEKQNKEISFIIQKEIDLEKKRIDYEKKEEEMKLANVRNLLENHYMEISEKFKNEIYEKKKEEEIKLNDNKSLMSSIIEKKKLYFEEESRKMEIEKNKEEDKKSDELKKINLMRAENNMNKAKNELENNEKEYEKRRKEYKEQKKEKQIKYTQIEKENQENQERKGK